jgi:hypothetical protein
MEPRGELAEGNGGLFEGGVRLVPTVTTGRQSFNCLDLLAWPIDARRFGTSDGKYKHLYNRVSETDAGQATDLAR